MKEDAVAKKLRLWVGHPGPVYLYNFMIQNIGGQRENVGNANVLRKS